jgi:hypothetical protein
MREKFRIPKISKHRRLKMYIKEENPEILKQKYEALIAQRKQTWTDDELELLMDWWMNHPEMGMEETERLIEEEERFWDSQEPTLSEMAFEEYLASKKKGKKKAKSVLPGDTQQFSKEPMLFPKSLINL